MPEVVFDAKEFKELIKTFVKFASYESFKKPTGVLLMEETGVTFILDTDRAYLSAKPQTVSFSGQADPYFFTLETLSKIAVTGKEKGIKLSWTSSSSPLTLSNGRFQANLNVAAQQPDFRHLPKEYDMTFKLPSHIFYDVTKFLNIPYSYFKAKSDLTPMHYKVVDGKLVVMADDGFSLAKLETDISVPEGVNFKVPKFVQDILYSGDEGKDGEFFTVGIQGFNIAMTNGLISIIFPGLNDQTSDFDKTIKTVGPWLTSCKFKPKLLAEDIKPLISVIPAKDTSGSIIFLAFKGTKALMSVKHKEVGDVMVEQVDGIDNIYNENNIHNVVINMHPQAFSDYTDLLKGNLTSEASMFGNGRVVYYESEIKHKPKEKSENEELPMFSAKVKYMFPTVQL
jgi:hypothetical protein